MAKKANPAASRGRTVPRTASTPAAPRRAALPMDFITSGWGGLIDRQPTKEEAEAEAAQTEARALKEYNLNCAVYRLFFGSPLPGDGEAVFRHYRNVTIEQPCFDPAQTNPEYQGFVREGQNSIIRDIEMRARKSQEGPPDTGTGANDED